MKQLALSPGERVLDIGCGPGFLCESIAAAVGSAGAVTGIDISSDLIALCRSRNPPQWLSYAVGDATQIAQPDASFDVVVCTQVAEYVPDVDRVLAETFRVLRPGGRAVFVATDWDAVVWHSEKPDRMASVMKSWESHCAHPRLPRSLPNRLLAQVFGSTARLCSRSSICIGTTTPTARVSPARYGISWAARTSFRRRPQGVVRRVRPAERSRPVLFQHQPLYFSSIKTIGGRRRAD